MEVAKVTNLELDLRAFCAVLLQEHCYDKLGNEYQSLFGIHMLLKDIESEKVHCYRVKENGKYLGFVFGELNADNNYLGHVIFVRGVDVAKACNLCAYYVYNELNADNIIAYIPNSNRAAILMAKRFGCKEVSKNNEITFLKRARGE